MTNMRFCTDMKTKHEDIMISHTTAISKLSASCSKSPLQSHVGSVSRISKLGAERIFLISSYIPTIRVNGIPKKPLGRCPYHRP